jgi:hypothetical protein
MHLVDKNGDRVLVARLVPPIDLAEAKQFCVDCAGVLKKIAPLLAICIVDVRASKAFAPEVADVFISLLRTDSPLIERSAILYSPGGSLGLQLVRMIRESNSRDRRISTDDRAEALTFLSGVANPEQLKVVERFLA